MSVVHADMFSAPEELLGAFNVVYTLDWPSISLNSSRCWRPKDAS